jgi:RNA polymerase sigma factor (TIGR02999 family)
VGNQPPPNSTDALAAALYDELRAMAAAYLSKEPDGHTLQPTALVNEALLRILGQQQGQAGSVWQNREQFLGVAAICMRRVLVDHARTRGREKRGGGAVRLSLDESLATAEAAGVDVLDLDAALEEFSASFPRQARVVELRSFAGLELEQIGEVVGISLAQVKRDWTFARAWLKARLDRGSASPTKVAPASARAPAVDSTDP